MNNTAAEQLVQVLRAKGISDEVVLKAISLTPRENFVHPDWQTEAYQDSALPFACGQTISQPYVVARMTELLRSGQDLRRVCEIGTGSGYQAAVLSRVAQEVYSIERIHALYEIASERLANYANIELKYDDGHIGWRQHAPFDGIIVTAATTGIPKKLPEQLTDGGRLVIPVGDELVQSLSVITREGDQFHAEEYDAVRFVPLLSGKDNNN